METLMSFQMSLKVVEFSWRAGWISDFCVGLCSMELASYHCLCLSVFSVEAVHTWKSTNTTLLPWGCFETSCKIHNWDVSWIWLCVPEVARVSSWCQSWFLYWCSCNHIPSASWQKLYRPPTGWQHYNLKVLISCFRHSKVNCTVFWVLKLYLRESQMFPQLLLLVSAMVCSSPLKMEAVWSFKTSGFLQTAWHLLLASCLAFFWPRRWKWYVLWNVKFLLSNF